MKLILSLLTLFLISCTPSQLNKEQLNKEILYVQDDGRREITIVAKFTEEERQAAYKSLELITLIVPSIKYEGYEDIPLYWMSSNEYAGLTVPKGRRRIMISTDYRINKTNNLSYLRFGCIFAHELSHALHETSDPETSVLVDDVIFAAMETEGAFIILMGWKP